MDLNLKKHHNNLLFLPLGGSSEIGMNMNLYHLNGKWIMVDCGVGFAYNIPGIDMMTPDISFIKQYRNDLIAIILTHIHEDHMGAVQYLWEELKVPVYASNFGANFLRSKLTEFKLDKTVPIRIIDSSRPLNLNPFQIEFIGLTHSVPEMKALMIKTNKGNVLHTGDWKLDPNPVVGDVSEIDKIKEYGKNNEILAIICDSTNAVNKGHSRSEGELHNSLKELIINRNGLVGVTTFASNIARISTIAKIAKEVGRKVVLSGFSLQRLYEVGKKSGYFTEEFDFISDREIKFYDKKQILVIARCCQGEEMASTRKIASGIHPLINFSKGDLMIFSSKIIPGNEKKIFELFDLFAKRNIDIMTEKDHFVHVSGHPYEDELREMYSLAKPKIAIPVHGEFLHTKINCEIAKDCGIEKTIQIENGLAINLDRDRINECEVVGKVKTGYMGVNGKQLIDLKSNIIRERKKLQEAGVVIISLALNDSLKMISPFRVKSVGCYDLKNDSDIEDLIHKEITFFLKNKANELDIHGGFGIHILRKKHKKKKLRESRVIQEIEKSLRSKILRIFEDIIGKRPAIEIIIHISN